MANMPRDVLLSLIVIKTGSLAVLSNVLNRTNCGSYRTQRQVPNFLLAPLPLATTVRSGHVLGDAVLSLDRAIAAHSCLVTA